MKHGSKQGVDKKPSNNSRMIAVASPRAPSTDALEDLRALIPKSPETPMPTEAVKKAVCSAALGELDRLRLKKPVDSNRRDRITANLGVALEHRRVPKDLHSIVVDRLLRRTEEPAAMPVMFYDVMLQGLLRASKDVTFGLAIDPTIHPPKIAHAIFQRVQSDERPLDEQSQKTYLDALFLTNHPYSAAISQIVDDTASILTHTNLPTWAVDRLPLLAKFSALSIAHINSRRFPLPERNRLARALVTWMQHTPDTSQFACVLYLLSEAGKCGHDIKAHEIKALKELAQKNGSEQSLNPQAREFTLQNIGYIEFQEVWRKKNQALNAEIAERTAKTRLFLQGALPESELVDSFDATEKAFQEIHQLAQEFCSHEHNLNFFAQDWDSEELQKKAVVFLDRYRKFHQLQDTVQANAALRIAVNLANRFQQKLNPGQAIATQLSEFDVITHATHDDIHPARSSQRFTPQEILNATPVLESGVKSYFNNAVEFLLGKISPEQLEASKSRQIRKMDAVSLRQVGIYGADIENEKSNINTLLQTLDKNQHEQLPLLFVKKYLRMKQLGYDEDAHLALKIAQYVAQAAHALPEPMAT